ncbi:MAG: DUF2071 domain-containing protein [Gemmataceae bacterium]
MSARPPRPALLEFSLLFTFVIHLLAMGTMPLLLMGGLPGGWNGAPAERAAFIADHPWLWRLGWLPWQITAFSDLLVSLAILRTFWLPRLSAWAGFLVTLLALIPDQVGQAVWITRGVDIATEAHATGSPQLYATFEAAIFPIVGGWGAILYLTMALCWTWTFAAAGLWTRGLIWISVLTWSVFAFAGVALVLPADLQPPMAVIAAANALAFLGLVAWNIGVGEQVFRVSRPDQPHGRWAPWRHPRSGPIARCFGAIANSRFLRGLSEWLPTLAFRSDITDVLYVNYLVDAARLTPLVPDGLELQRLGPDRRHALLTFLTYNHGHFGPRILGPLRRLLPSPVQSNWRIYVRDPRTGQAGIYFFTNAIDRTLHALAARLFAEGMPMHRLAKGEVSRLGDGGAYHLRLDPGAGTAPDADATLRPAARTLPDAWRPCFADYRAFLDYCVPQDRALSVQPWYGRVTRQEIHLGIDLADVEPLQGEVCSRAAEAIVGPAAPVCFRVPRVSFLFDREEHDPLSGATA